MRLNTTGRANNITTPVVGRITTKPLSDRAESILVTQLDGVAPPDITGYRAVVTPTPQTEGGKALLPKSGVYGVYEVDEVSHLRDGDIVVLQQTGAIRTLFRPDSVHNALFVTERCNSNCLMCPQPPKDRDDSQHFLGINRELIRLIPPTTSVLGITGGEPTLLRDDLWHLVELLKEGLPNTHIHLLTNGRLFAWPENTARFASVNHPDLVLGVPLYSDSATLHDYIVQAKGAFDQTVLGLHQLARWHQRVELRLVLHKLTIPRLLNLAEYIYRNLPFVEHIALMGLEPVGYTPYNRDKLWIDTYEYQGELEQAVEYLTIRGMSVSIDNLQHCVIPPSLWGFARRSISDWKNTFLPACAGCERDSWGGFFESSERMASSHIRPLTSALGSGTDQPFFEGLS